MSLRRNREEVGAIFPLHSLAVHQIKVSLINQGSGLQAVARAFPTHIIPGEPTQFVVDDGRQLIEGSLTPFAPGAEQCAHIALG
jgi:hypothetical protein